MTDAPPVPEVGEFIAQSKQNAESLRALRSEFTGAIDALRSAIERIGDKLNTATRPNISTFVSICGVMVGVISLIGGVIGFFLWHAIEQGNTNIINLDIKLQREFQLAIQTGDARTTNLNEVSKERHERVMRETETLRDWQKSHDQSDLEELRQRRLKDVARNFSEQIKQSPAVSGIDGGKNYDK